MYKRKNINDIVNETAKEFGEVRVHCKLQDKIDELGINLSELATITGIRYASLNELKNGKKVTLNLQHTLAIMCALRIKSFDELFELQFEDKEEEARFNAESEVVYEKELGLPESVLMKISANKPRIEAERKRIKKISTEK